MDIYFLKYIELNMYDDKLLRFNMDQHMFKKLSIRYIKIIILFIYLFWVINALYCHFYYETFIPLRNI